MGRTDPAFLNSQFGIRYSKFSFSEPEKGGAAFSRRFQTSRISARRRLPVALPIRRDTTKRSHPNERSHAQAGAGPPRLLQDPVVHGAAEPHRRAAPLVRALPADEPPPRGA